MTLSLKDEILEKLHLKKGGKKTASSNISKATKDFATSDAPQFRGKSQKKRHQMAVAAGLSAARGESANPKIGDKMIYEGKQVVVRSINEITGMAIVKLPKFRDPKIVRACDLSVPQQLTEGILGIAAIAPTYREETVSQFIKFDLDPEDIGLLWEDTQEEPDDNGSNVRHDGHTGRTEVDELPTPSDTISPAYSDETPPKEMGTPLSIEPGYTVATDPDFDGYDYPADAPDIPKPDFTGSDNGNPRSPHWSGDHNAGDGLEDREHDDDERTDENFDRSHHEYPSWQEPVSDDWRRQQERRRKRGLDTGGAHYTQKNKMRVGRHGDSKQRPDTQFENRRRRNGFSFVNEDGGMADRYVDFMDKGGTDMDFDAHGGNVTPGQIPSPQGMGGDMAHDSQYGAFSPVRGGTGPTQIPTGMPSTPPPTPPTPPTPNLQAGGAIPNTSGSMNQASAAPLPQVPHYGPNLESRAIASYKKLLAEMGDMLNGDEHEPKSSDTITVTLPAMASIVCTVAHKMQGDQNLMKSMIEALAEVGHGKTIDTPDLEAVASHMNGEETQEIENREEGHPEHQGIEISGGNGGIEVNMPSDKWPGDGEKSGTGKTKLMGGLGESEEEEVEECDDEMKECDDEEMAESDDNFYGWDDIVAETYKPTYEEELRMIKRRAGLKFW